MTTEPYIRDLTNEEIAAVSGADGHVAGGFLPTAHALTVLIPVQPIIPVEPIIPIDPIFGQSPATPVINILFNVST